MAGTYSATEGLLKCKICPKGLTSENKVSSCKLCAAGTYSWPVGQPCTPCPAGTYGSYTGLWKSTKCQKGFQSTAGSTWSGVYEIITLQLGHSYCSQSSTYDKLQRVFQRSSLCGSLCANWKFLYCASCALLPPPIIFIDKLCSIFHVELLRPRP